ncbi:Pre-mRNA-processing-splicing factor 8A [Cucumispora dikerogammari]|nr:Pre-mRNA-processing-splicing factor 8A [Cucumispora dikerogammari]
MDTNKKIQVPFEYLLSLYSLNKTRPTKDILKFMDLIPYTTASLIKLCFIEIKYLNVVFDGFGRLCIIRDMKQEKFEIKQFINTINLKNAKNEKLLISRRRKKKSKKEKKNSKSIFKKNNVLKLKELKFTTNLPLFKSIKKENICLPFSLIFSQFHIIICTYLFERKLSFLKINSNFEIENLRKLTTKEKKKSRFKILNVLIDSIRIAKAVVEASFDLNVIKSCDEFDIFPIKFVKKERVVTSQTFEKIRNTNDLISNMSFNTKIYRHKYKIISFLKAIKCVFNFKNENKLILYFTYRNILFSLFRGLVPYLVIRLNRLIFRLFYGRNSKKVKRKTKQRFLSNLDINLKKALYDELKVIYKIRNKKIFRKRLFLLFNEMWKYKKNGFDIYFYKITSLESEDQKTFKDILIKYLNKKYEILKKVSLKYELDFWKVFTRNFDMFNNVSVVDKQKYENIDTGLWNHAHKRVKPDDRESPKYIKTPIFYKPVIYKDAYLPKLKFYNFSKDTKIHRTRLTRYLLTDMSLKKNNLNFKALNILIEVLNRIPNRPFKLFHAGMNYTPNFNDIQSIINIFSNYESQYLIARKKFLRRFQIEETDFELFIKKSKSNEMHFILENYFLKFEEHSISVSLNKNLLEKRLMIKKPSFKIPAFKIRRNAQIQSFLEDQGINLLIDSFFNEIIFNSFKKLIPNNMFLNENKTLLFISNLIKTSKIKPINIHKFKYKLDIPIFVLRNLLESEKEFCFSSIFLDHFIKRLDTKINFKDMSFIPFFYLGLYEFDESFQVLFMVLVQEILKVYGVDCMFIEKGGFGVICDDSCCGALKEGVGISDDERRRVINSQGTATYKEVCKKIQKINAEISDFLFIEEASAANIFQYNYTLTEPLNHTESDVSLIRYHPYSIFNNLVLNISFILSATLSHSELITRYNNTLTSFIRKHGLLRFPLAINSFTSSIIRKIMETINSKMFSRYTLSMFYGPPGIGLGLLNIQFHTDTALTKDPMVNFLNQTNLQLFTEKTTRKISYKRYYENMINFLGGIEEIRKQTLSYGLTCEPVIVFDRVSRSIEHKYRFVKVENTNSKYQNYETKNGLYKENATDTLSSTVLKYKIPSEETKECLHGKKIQSQAQIRALSLLSNKYFLLNWLPTLNTSNVFIGEKERVLKYIWVIGKLKGLKSSIKRIFEIKGKNENLMDLLILYLKNIMEQYFKSENIQYERYAERMFLPDFILNYDSDSIHRKNKEHKANKYSELLITVSLNDDSASIYEEFKNKNFGSERYINENIKEENCEYKQETNYKKNIDKCHTDPGVSKYEHHSKTITAFYENNRENTNFLSLIHINIVNKTINTINCSRFLTLAAINKLKPRMFNNSIFEGIEANIKTLLNVKETRKTDVKTMFKNILIDEKNDVVFLPREGFFMDIKVFESMKCKQSNEKSHRPEASALIKYVKHDTREHVVSQLDGNVGNCSENLPGSTLLDINLNNQVLAIDLDKEIIKTTFCFSPFEKCIKRPITCIYSILDFFDYTIPLLIEVYTAENSLVSRKSTSNFIQNNMGDIREVKSIPFIVSENGFLQKRKDIYNEKNNNIEKMFTNFCFAVLYLQCINNSIDVSLDFLNKITIKICSLFGIKNDFQNLFDFYSNLNITSLNYECLSSSSNFPSSVENVEKNEAFLKKESEEDIVLILKKIKKEFYSKLNHLAGFLTEKLVNKLKDKKQLKRKLSDFEIRKLIFNLNVFPDLCVSFKEGVRVFLNGMSNSEFFKRYFDVEVEEVVDYQTEDFKKDLWYVRDSLLLVRSNIPVRSRESFEGVEDYHEKNIHILSTEVTTPIQSTQGLTKKMVFHKLLPTPVVKKNLDKNTVYLYSILDLISKKKGIYLLCRNSNIINISSIYSLNENSIPNAANATTPNISKIFGIVAIKNNENKRNIEKYKFNNICFQMTFFNNSLLLEFEESKVVFNCGECPFS